MSKVLKADTRSGAEIDFGQLLGDLRQQKEDRDFTTMTAVPSPEAPKE